MIDAEPSPSARSKAGKNNGRALPLFVLSLIFCVSYMDRVMVGALAPAIKADFAMSDTEIGLLMGFAFTIFYACAGIPLARFADRGSRRLLISLSVAAWSLMTVTCGLAQTSWQLFLARVGVGIGEAGSSPASISLLSDLYSPQKRPIALSLYLAGGMLGVMLGLSLGGWIGGHFGWRWAFICLGAPGLLLAVIGYVIVPDPVRGATEANYQASATPIGTREAFRQLGGNTPFWWIISGSALTSFSILGMSQWLPSFFVRTHNLSLEFVALFFGFVFGGGMIVGQLIGGVWASRLSRRHAIPLHIPIWASLSAAPLYLIVLWVPQSQAAVAMCFVSALVGALLSPSLTAAVQAAVQPHLRSTAQAIGNFVLSMLSLGLGALLVGVVSDVLTPLYGEDALRVALSLSQAMTLIAAFCFVRAARSLTLRSPKTDVEAALTPSLAPGSRPPL